MKNVPQKVQKYLIGTITRQVKSMKNKNPKIT